MFRSASKASRALTPGLLFLALLTWPNAASGQVLRSTGTLTGLRMWGPNVSDWWLDTLQNRLDVRANGSATPWLSILPNGNVGIGTASPAGPLDVYTPATGEMWLGRFVGGGTAYGGMYQDGNGKLNLLMYDSGPKVFLRTAGDSYLLGGNLGVGTASPGAKLEAYGNLAVTNVSAGIGLGQTLNFNLMPGLSYSKIKIGAYDTVGGSYGRGGLAFMLNVDAGSADASFADTRMYLQQFTGNVGIGTTAPSMRTEIQTANVFDGLAITGTAAGAPAPTSAWRRPAATTGDSTSTPTPGRASRGSSSRRTSRTSSLAATQART